MAQSHIYFDIDKTLIDSTKLLSNCGAALEKAGVKRDIFTQIVDEYVGMLPSKTSFNPETLLQKLSDATQIETATLQTHFWQAEAFAAAVYYDVIPTLQQAAKNHQLGTFSQGVLDWQQKKLQLSGLEKFFVKDLILIAPDKLADSVVIRLAEKATVIDDKKDVVEHLRTKRSDLHVFRIVRDELTDRAQHQIQTLADVLTFQEL